MEDDIIQVRGIYYLASEFKKNKLKESNCLEKIIKKIAAATKASGKRLMDWLDYNPCYQDPSRTALYEKMKNRPYSMSVLRGIY